MYRLIYFIGSFFFLYQSCQQAPAKLEVLDRVLKTNVLRVGTTGDYPPFTLQNNQSTYEGIDIDMAHELAATLGAKVEFVPTTWATLLEDLQLNKFDIAMGGISKKLSRQQVGLFSEGYEVEGKTPISRCEDVERYNSLDKIDQPGVRVIVNPGGTNQVFVEKRLKKARIRIHPDNTTIFQQLVENKADVMITDAAEVKFQSHNISSLCPTMPDQLFDKFEKGYLMPQDLIWKEYVDAWLKEMILKNEVEAIFTSYFQ